MSKDKAASKTGSDNTLSDAELAKVAGGTLKLDGVEGESTHKDHKGEIEVLSWSSSTPAAPKKR